jgi:SARP family transcriptional regulator, regulator of embCAB operon
MRTIRVELFGATAVVLADGSRVTDLGGIKPRQVLEMLALSVGAPVSKDRLVEQLWGGHPPRTFMATLESYISLLRRRLGVGRGRGSALATTSNGYLLDPALVSVDVEEFRGLVRPAAGMAPAVGVARIGRALGLVSGELLASEPYADWAAQERAVFGAEYLQACNRAAGYALAAGDPHTAVGLARRAIGCDEMAESSWQLLIRALSATGARSEALRAYLDLRRTLVDALGAEPGPASRALYLDLLAQDRAAATPATSVHEVRTLLGLLRDALGALPDLDLSPRDRRLTEKAAHLVSAA